MPLVSLDENHQINLLYIKKVYYPQGRAIGKIKLFSTICVLEQNLQRHIQHQTKNRKKKENIVKTATEYNL